MTATPRVLDEVSENQIVSCIVFFCHFKRGVVFLELKFGRGVIFGGGMSISATLAWNSKR